MAVEVTTDLARIAVLIKARLADDPVRATVLGTISLRLHEHRCTRQKTLRATHGAQRAAPTGIW